MYVDVTLTRSKVKVKVTGLLNFRQLAKQCMLAAMTAAPLRGFLVQDGGRRHLVFINFHNFNYRNAQEAHTALSCQISWRSVKLSRRYADFSIFQYGDFPPSWICDAHIWTTHEGHLVVFITVQNLVGIDAVVSKICMFFDFATLA